MYRSTYIHGYCFTNIQKHINTFLQISTYRNIHTNMHTDIGTYLHIYKYIRRNIIIHMYI